MILVIKVEIIAKKDFCNPLTRVSIFCSVVTFISCLDYKKAIYCKYNAKLPVIRNKIGDFFMLRKRRQSQKENYIHVLQEKERKTNQKTDTQQYSHVRLSNQRFITMLTFPFLKIMKTREINTTS